MRATASNDIKIKTYTCRVVQEFTVSLYIKKKVVRVTIPIDTEIEAILRGNTLVSHGLYSTFQYDGYDIVIKGDLIKDPHFTNKLLT